MTLHDRSKTPNIYQLKMLTGQPCRTEHRVLNLARKCAQFCAEIRSILRGNAINFARKCAQFGAEMRSIWRGNALSLARKCTRRAPNNAQSIDVNSHAVTRSDGLVTESDSCWEWRGRFQAPGHGGREGVKFYSSRGLGSDGLGMAAVLEFLNNLWGLGTELEYCCLTGLRGYTAWRNWFPGIDSWTP
jgi:hypothetical protein